MTEPNEIPSGPDSVPSTLSKQSHAEFVRTWTDQHLILHLTHKAEIWFNDADILALEEFVRRFKAHEGEVTKFNKILEEHYITLENIP